MPEQFSNQISLGTLRDRIAEKFNLSESPDLDALILVETVSGRHRADLLAELRSPVASVLSDTALATLSSLVEQRRRGTSIAYLTGVKEFYGYEFQVGPGALVPRPESEHLVEEGLRLLEKDSHAVIHDCCTGTGCVGIALARERALRGYTTEVLLSDIEPAALSWATRNATRLLAGIHAVRALVERRNLLRPLSPEAPADTIGRYDLITANPPYLTPAEMDQITVQGSAEPQSALHGGTNGLELYPELATQAFALLRWERYVLAEHGWTQGSAVRTMFMGAGFDSVDTICDLAGRDRLVRARRPADNLERDRNDTDPRRSTA